MPKLHLFEGHQVPMIKYKGPFDWAGLYRLTRNWLIRNKFIYQEKRYKHKGEEVEVEMRAERKITEMIKYHIEINFHLWYLKNTKEGPLPNTANVWLEIKGSVEWDYSEKFSGKWGEKIGGLWFKLMKNEIENVYVDSFTYELYALHKEVKSFLNMKTDYNAF